MQAASAQAGAGLCERNEQFRHSVRYRLENARQAKRPGGRLPCGSQIKEFTSATVTANMGA
jgi:hypothetical protein